MNKQYSSQKQYINSASIYNINPAFIDSIANHVFNHLRDKDPIILDARFRDIPIELFFNKNNLVFKELLEWERVEGQIVFGALLASPDNELKIYIQDDLAITFGSSGNNWQFIPNSQYSLYIRSHIDDPYFRPDVRELMIKVYSNKGDD